MPRPPQPVYPPGNEREKPYYGQMVFAQARKVRENRLNPTAIGSIIAAGCESR
jgi:hypothetical protein